MKWKLANKSKSYMFACIIINFVSSFLDLLLGYANVKLQLSSFFPKLHTFFSK